MKFFDNLIDVKIEKDMGILGVTDEFFCVYLYSVFNKYNKNILVVVDSITEANLLYSKLTNFTEDVLLFPMDDFLTSEALAISPDLMMERLNTLNCLVKDEKKIIICPPPQKKYCVHNLLSASREDDFYRFKWNQIKHFQFPDDYADLTNPWKN